MRWWWCWEKGLQLFNDLQSTSRSYQLRNEIINLTYKSEQTLITNSASVKRHGCLCFLYDHYSTLVQRSISYSTPPILPSSNSTAIQSLQNNIVRVNSKPQILRKLPGIRRLNDLYNLATEIEKSQSISLAFNQPTNGFPFQGLRVYLLCHMNTVIRAFSIVKLLSLYVYWYTPRLREPEMLVLIAIEIALFSLP